MQRLFDIFFSVIAILFLLPLIIPVMILLRLTGEHEVFYSQERVGKNGKPFKLFKFTTMLKNSPNMGAGTITVKDDPRILPVGKFLRDTKINELPQLINIILGDMSIVGPRPQAHRCFLAFPEELQNTLVKVRPGLSGIGSIVFRGEEDILAGKTSSQNYYDKVIAPYKAEIETWYLSHQNLFNYFIVIFLTVWVIMFPRSPIVWRVFPNLPVPPESLKKSIKHNL